jgi:hypothetical protein
MLSVASFIGTVDDRVKIHFVRKKVPFYFNSPHSPDAELRSQKGEV